METELIQLFEAVKKAADIAAVDGGGIGSSAAEEGRCLDALKRLEKFPVNYKVLASTQVGKRIRYLTKHPKKSIQALASNLIVTWRNIILEESNKNKNKKTGSLHKEEAKPACADKVQAKKVQKVKSTKVEKVEAVKLVKTDRTGTLSSEKVVKTEKNFSEKWIGVEEKQTSDSSKSSCVPVTPLKPTSVTKCNDAIRGKIRELLSEALCKVSGEVDEDLRAEVNGCDPFLVAAAVESKMFEKWGRSNGTHKFKYRSVMFNINDPKNPDFRRKVLLGHVKPEMIPKMTPEEMASRQRQLENEQIKEKALFDCQRDDGPKATTAAFRCGRCGKREASDSQMQTRSADEPMTTFVTCANCNNRWKFC